MKYGTMFDKLYVPFSSLPSQKILDHFTHYAEVFVPQHVCRTCMEDKCLKFTGEPCPFSVKVLKMYNIRRDLNAVEFWRGDIKKLFTLFPKLIVNDNRNYPIINNPLEFEGELRPYQKEGVLKWCEYKYGGQIQAPARSGKTVMGVYITTKLNTRTLITAQQIDLLEQFYETYLELTNVKDIRTIDNPIVTLYRPKMNLERVLKQNVVVLATYQSFIKSVARLKLIRNKFGFVVVDECHRAAAECHSEFVTALNPSLFLGLTATPDRKDGREILSRYALGPVVSRVSPPELSGDAVIVYTKRKVNDFASWTTFISRLVLDEIRNRLILEYMKEDLSNGHYILMVTDRNIKHCRVLYDRIKQMGISVMEYSGSVKDREGVRKRIRAGKARVTVATRKAVSHGVNVPIWSCYYCLTPTTNPQGIYQELSRIRTPYENKQRVLARVFIDGVHAATKKTESVFRKVLINNKFDIYTETTRY